MNVPLESQSSLYEIVQQIQPFAHKIIVSAPTLKFVVSSFFDILIEQQPVNNILVKLPQTKSWLSEIQKYQNRGNVEKIYVCNLKKEHQSSLVINKVEATNTQTNNRINFIDFKHNNYFKKEFFLIVVSNDFYFLILAQWQTEKIQIEALKKRLQQPYFKILFTFDTNTIERAIEVIRKASNDFSFDLKPNSTNLATENDYSTTKFLSDLFVRQIQQIDRVQISSKTERTETQSLDLREDKTFTNEFLRNLVTELRSPLTQTKTALSLLESKQLKGEQRQRYLQLIDRECDRQNSLISGLLQLMELDNTADLDLSATVKLEDLVPGTVSTYQPLAEEKGIQLGYTIPSGFPPIACPSSWLRQILVNLLNNSLRFTPSGGKVFVQAALRNDNVELTFSDTGVGIDPKELPKIFNSFYRGRSAINEQGSGAGLGLTIVRQALDRCGGTISVNSRVGKGSVFRVLLPVIPTELSDE
jgi:two-component system, OmpR family, phosphate regulon sensor histidine kinase PhoR